MGGCVYDFLVNTASDEQADSALLRFAFGLARQHGAHLTGLQVIAYDASLLIVPDALIVLDREERAAKGRDAWWQALCIERGVPGTWEVHRGFYQSVVARRASLADLVLGSLGGRGATPQYGGSLLGRSLFAEAVPVLLVPREWPGKRGVRRIVIAWNGSAEAARAVRTASPLLARATKVFVLDGETSAGNAGDGPRRPPPLPLKAWLERHGIVGNWQRIESRQVGGRGIHDLATGLKADLLVMGAWGHTRMGEWLLGGVTRYMLRNGRLPLLLAH